MMIGPVSVVEPGNVNGSVCASLASRQNHHATRRQTRRHNHEHARRRIRHKIPELSDIDTAIYLFLHNLNDTERDFLFDVKTYLTKG